jgi:hypothetical protein
MELGTLKQSPETLATGEFTQQPPLSLSLSLSGPRRKSEITREERRRRRRRRKKEEEEVFFPLVSGFRV